MIPLLTSPKPGDWRAQEPWQRQPCDDDRSWQWFLQYLKLPHPRRLQSMSGPLEELRKIAQANYWNDRAAEYDNYVNQEYHGQLTLYTVARAQSTLDKHLQLLDDGLELASIELSRRLDEAKRSSMSGTISMRETIQVVEAFIKLRELLVGKPTDRVENVEVDKVLHEMNPEQLEALRSVQQLLEKKR